MTRKIRIAWIAGAVAVVAAALWAFGVLGPAAGGLDPTNPATTLADIERTVTGRYPVPEMAGAELSAALGDPDTVVFDVREPDEYAQSHIPGAIRIDPGMTAGSFMASHGTQTAGKRVVFYCAVGVRSAIMTQRTESPLTRNGALGVYNLRGGIFRWHASGGRLAAAGGAASSVHPYDGAWGQLLERTLSGASPARDRLAPARQQGVPRP